MIKYETKEDQHNNIKNAIVATNKNTNVSIYIDVLTIVSSTEENYATYQIKHGNYFPKSKDDNGEVLRATWDQFYIDGKEDGYPNGFRTLNDISEFINEEIKRIENKKNESLISNDDICNEGVRRERWNLVHSAWLNFQKRFEGAMKENKLIDVNKAKEMVSTLYN